VVDGGMCGCDGVRASPACEGGFETRPYVAAIPTTNISSFPSFGILSILVQRRGRDRRALFYSGFPRARE